MGSTVICKTIIHPKINFTLNNKTESKLENMQETLQSKNDTRRTEGDICSAYNFSSDFVYIYVTASEKLTRADIDQIVNKYNQQNISQMNFKIKERYLQFIR